MSLNFSKLKIPKNVLSWGKELCHISTISGTTIFNCWSEFSFLFCSSSLYSTGSTWVWRRTLSKALWLKDNSTATLNARSSQTSSKSSKIYINVLWTSTTPNSNKNSSWTASFKPFQRTSNPPQCRQTSKNTDWSLVSSWYNSGSNSSGTVRSRST